MKTLFASKKQRGSKAPVSTFREWVGSIFFAAIGAALIRWLVIGLYVIPSASMEPTLLTGDFVLVSKIHYGARTPATPLQLPITHQTIPGTKVASYLDWIQLPQYRLPGLGKVKRNDIIVFNTPVDSDRPIDLREYWIKRCVALPGDVLSIDHKQLYVNGELEASNDVVQHCYFMKTKRILTSGFFEKNDIKNPVISTVFGHEGYTIYTTASKVKQLTTVLPTYIQSVEPVEDIKGECKLGIYPFSTVFCWTKDNFGPLKVPKKGMTIQITEENIILYGNTIRMFEGKKDIRFIQGTCWIDDQQVEAYTFCKDYYFAMGDNRDQSGDSRFIGFIPEDHIVGKAVMVLLSSDRNKHFFEGMRWNRLFQIVN